MILRILEFLDYTISFCLYVLDYGLYISLDSQLSGFRMTLFYKTGA